MNSDALNTKDALDTNLLASQKKVKTIEPSSAPPQKKWIKISIYASIFLAAFVFFASLKLPSTFIQGIVLGALNQNNQNQWQADTLGLRLFWLPHIRAENLTMIPSAMSTVPSFSFQKIRIYPSYLSLIPITGSFRPAASFDGEAYGSEFSGWVSPSKPDFELKLENADLSKITPLVEEGIDIKGILNLTLQLALENQRLSKSQGKFQLSGKNFVVDPAAFGVPMPLPILDLGAIEIEGEVQNGKVRFQKAQIGSSGKDLELKATGEIQLADMMQFSRIDLRLKLKPSAKILTAMPALKTMLGTIAAEQADGFYGMKLSGTLSQMGMPQPDR
jgi:type II secretion system protein N